MRGLNHLIVPVFNLKIILVYLLACMVYSEDKQLKSMKPTNQYIYRGHIPYVRFLIAVLTGIAFGIFIAPIPSLFLVIQYLNGILLVLFFCIFFLGKRLSVEYFSWIGAIWFGILALGGWASVWKTHPEIDKLHFSRHEASTIVGYISDEPVLRGEHIRFPLMVTGSHHNDKLHVRSGQLLLTVRLDSTLKHHFQYGSILAIPANYNTVSPPYNPGELDYRRYLKNKNIWHQAYIGSTEDIILLNGFEGSRMVSYALQMRQTMVSKFARYLEDKDTLSIASTLILGYRADLSPELLHAFSATGTIHVLSVSGMHVVIVFWLLSKLLWWMERTKGLRFVRWVILLVCVWVYALVTGFSPSVLRASMMISFVITAGHFSREARVYNSIAASAFFLLLHDPKFVLDVGFQLSYLAVLSIVFLMPILQQAMPVKKRLVKPIWDYSLMSVSAQAGAFPLATFYFNQFPVYFLPANLLIVIPASFIMYLGFALLFIPFDTLCRWIGLALESLILAMNDILFYIERLPLASLRGVWLVSWEFIALYVLMLSAVFALSYKRKSLIYVAATCFSLLLVSSFWATTRKVVGRQAVIYNLRRNLAVGIMDNGKVVLYSNLPSLDDRVIEYSVAPHLEYHTSLDHVDFVKQDSVYHSASVSIRSGVVQWGDRRLFVYDGDPVFDSELAVDVLLLRNNPHRPLADIVRATPCRKIVIDGSNYDNTIARIEAEAEAMGIPVYVLKNNFAYVWRDSD